MPKISQNGLERISPTKTEPINEDLVQEKDKATNSLNFDKGWYAMSRTCQKNMQIFNFCEVDDTRNVYIAKV